MSENFKNQSVEENEHDIIVRKIRRKRKIIVALMVIIPKQHRDIFAISKVLPPTA